MDVLALSRWQFAITTIYHFLFVPLTLGLSIFIALLETCYVQTKHEEWKKSCRQLVKFFGTVFLINFAMGVITGIVQEFHFGMNLLSALSAILLLGEGGKKVHESPATYGQFCR